MVKTIPSENCNCQLCIDYRTYRKMRIDFATAKEAEDWLKAEIEKTLTEMLLTDAPIRRPLE